jgi:DNA-binding transcriptional MocR family regulator
MTQYRISGRSAAELIESVESGVASGALAPGQALPSVRWLAADVGLSPGTVAGALAELRRRGVVLTERRRGTRIGAAPPIGASRSLLAVPPGVRDLSRGNPDPRLLPDAQAALQRSAGPAHLYGEPSVLPGLAALAREQLQADGIPAEDLCVVSGALDGIERVLAAHLRPGDLVAVENPGYAALLDLLRAHGLAPAGVGVDDRGMRPAELEAALARGARALVITPRGQNPTGAALDAVRARELRAVLAGRPEALVIEDDHLGLLAGAPLHSAVAGRSRWAATRSVAKALGPDLRLAILAGDPLTVARVEGRQQCGPGWVSHILQRLVLALWSDAEVRAQIAHARATYDARREALLRALQASGVPARGSSGLNVWVPVEDEAAAVAALLQRGWAVAPGGPYRLPGAKPAVRVTTATLDGAEAPQLAQELAGVLARGPSARTG